ncbi:MAG: hypothetical protein N2484_17145 [Clostridia bacterium]|nr:hypothetical protein [Clostridia bacterium]
MMEKKITYFEQIKEDHTEETFKLVEERLTDSDIKKVVLASTTGAAAEKAMQFFKGKEIKLVVIPHQYDFSRVDNPFPSEMVQRLREAGHEVHFGTMLFHTDRLFGSNIPTTIANFLRCFCEGVKVCYEIVLMAADAGLLEIGEEVIAIAGTGRGSDTAMVMQASSTQHLNKLKINEILCKPLNQLNTANQ